MTDVNNGSYMADLSSAGDELVVFLIGMRVNKPWKLSAWWPVFTAMPKMLRYLEEHPEKGLLGYRQAFLPAPILVQYWWSFADLERFARAGARARAPLSPTLKLGVEIPVIPPAQEPLPAGADIARLTGFGACTRGYSSHTDLL